MKEVDKAYLAGFLDGDGSIIASIEPHKELRLGYRVRVVVKFSQCKEGKPLLKALQQLVGFGYISTSGNASEYVVKEKRKAKKLLEALRPYIKAKKQQVELALEILNSPAPSASSI